MAQKFLDSEGVKTLWDKVKGYSVSKSGDTMTGKLTTPILATGDDASNYFQSRKFRGEGNADTYFHAIDFGYQYHDQVDFYEYGGIWNFWVNVDSTATTDTSNRVASLQLGKLVERNNELTYPGKSGTLATTDDITNAVSNISVAAGTNINSVGTPSVTYSNGKFTFDYLKGETGAKGDKGEAGCSFSLSGTTLIITWNEG